VYYIGYVGECVERFKVEGPVHSLLLHNERQVMAVVTQDMVLSQFSVNSEGQTTQTKKVVLCRGRGATGGVASALSLISLASRGISSQGNLQQLLVVLLLTL